MSSIFLKIIGEIILKSCFTGIILKRYKRIRSILARDNSTREKLGSTNSLWDKYIWDKSAPNINKVRQINAWQLIYQTCAALSHIQQNKFVENHDFQQSIHPLGQFSACQNKRSMIFLKHFFWDNLFISDTNLHHFIYTRC